MSTFDFSQFKNSVVASNPIPIQKQEAIDTWEDDSITYVTVTQDRLSNNRRNFPVILPHVDRAVVVDGFSKDGTYEYLQSMGPKVQIYQRAWDDSFANQYNEYLRHIKGGWVLLCDDDELPSEGMLSVLREIVSKSEKGTKFDIVEFRALSISYTEGDWNNRHHPEPCDYYRQMFFKWNPGLRYEVDLHQSLQGLHGPGVRCNEYYYHIKSTKDEFRNACRNYFIAGRWPHGPRTDGIRTPEWHELKKILADNHPEVQLFSQLNALLITGQVCNELENWLRRSKECEDEDAGELRAYYRYYFEFLHPNKGRDENCEE